MESVIDKVNKCLEKYIGGEIFFEKLDEMLKFDESMLREFIEKVTAETNGIKLIASGEFGLCLHNYKIPVDILVPGSLRNGTAILNLEEFVKPGQRYMFLDDSYFSGKTAGIVEREVKRCGGNFVGCYVIYDGSKCKLQSVKSLYRYYDHHELQRDYHVKLIMSDEYFVKAKSPEEAKDIAVGKFGSDYYVDSVEVTEIRKGEGYGDNY